jgi:rubrerythrin
MSFYKILKNFQAAVDGDAPSCDAYDLMIAEVGELQAALHLSKDQEATLAKYTQNFETLATGQNVQKCCDCGALFEAEDCYVDLCPVCQERHDKWNASMDETEEYLNSYLLRVM